MCETNKNESDRIKTLTHTNETFSLKTPSDSIQKSFLTQNFKLINNTYKGIAHLDKEAGILELYTQPHFDHHEIPRAGLYVLTHISMTSETLAKDNIMTKTDPSEKLLITDNFSAGICYPKRSNILKNRMSSLSELANLKIHENLGKREILRGFYIKNYSNIKESIKDLDIPKICKDQILKTSNDCFFHSNILLVTSAVNGSYNNIATEPEHKLYLLNPDSPIVVFIINSGIVITQDNFEKLYNFMQLLQFCAKLLKVKWTALLASSENLGIQMNFKDFISFREFYLLSNNEEMCLRIDKTYFETLQSQWQKEFNNTCPSLPVIWER